MKTREREIGGDALNASERQILALWDGGLGKRAIVRRGFSKSYVDATIKTFCHDAGTDRAFANATRAASVALAAACIATGSWFR